MLDALEEIHDGPLDQDPLRVWRIHYDSLLISNSEEIRFSVNRFRSVLHVRNVRLTVPEVKSHFRRGLIFMNLFSYASYAWCTWSVVSEWSVIFTVAFNPNCHGLENVQTASEAPPLKNCLNACTSSPYE